MEFYGVAMFETTANHVISTRVDTVGWDPNQGLSSLLFTLSPKETSTLDLSVTPMEVNLGDTLDMTATIDPPRSEVPVEFTLYAPDGTIRAR